MFPVALSTGSSSSLLFDMYEDEYDDDDSMPEERAEHLLVFELKESHVLFAPEALIFVSQIQVCNHNGTDHCASFLHLSLFCPPHN